MSEINFPSTPFELEVYHTLIEKHNMPEPVAKALAISANHELERIRMFNELLLDDSQTGIYKTLVGRGVETTQAKLLAIRASKQSNASTKAKRIMEDQS